MNYFLLTCIVYVVENLSSYTFIHLLLVLETVCHVPFGTPNGAYVDNTPISVVSADFNNDTKLDLTVVNKDDNNIDILLGNGYDTFQSQMTDSAMCSPTSVIAGDFNNDKKLDLVANNNQGQHRQRVTWQR